MTYFNQWDISNHDTSRFKSACVLELALLGTLGPPPYEQSWASLLNDLITSYLITLDDSQSTTRHVNESADQRYTNESW